MNRRVAALAAALSFVLTLPGLAVASPADNRPADEAAQDAPPKAPAKNRRPIESLMFTVDEYNEIRGRIGSGQDTDAHSARQAIEDATLYLSTIVYYGPKEWTIWVNGVPVGPDQEFKSFQVTDINSDSVQLLVPLSAQGMRPVRLSPNQTFITKSGTVVEGRVSR
jgi:hypothetical protein